MMGELPLERLTPNIRPFTYVGMDYFGPMHIKTGKKKEKRYGVLFTCLSTRAIHLELASPLSTDSCIMAIRRMMSRRGHPHEILSDNATNFRGAAQELKQSLTELDENKVKNVLSNEKINWRFNPPGCPHMGGAWERLIRSVKSTLKAILRDQAPTEEMLRTVLVEAEAIVNSRPLTHVSLDHEDDEGLTPNGQILLFGEMLKSPPPPPPPPPPPLPNRKIIIKNRVPSTESVKRIVGGR